jgi:hypothetical protein
MKTIEIISKFEQTILCATDIKSIKSEYHADGETSITILFPYGSERVNVANVDDAKKLYADLAEFWLKRMDGRFTINVNIDQYNHILVNNWAVD